MPLVPLPDSPESIDAQYLRPLLSEFLGFEQEVETVKITRLERGTSSSRLYTVAAQDSSAEEPLRLILKLSAYGDLNETWFYRDMRAGIPVDTPHVLDARVLEDGRGWLLMEALDDAKDGLSWTVADYREVVRDMARLHAAFWGQARPFDGCGWLWRPTDDAIRQQVAGLRDDLAAIEATGFAAVVPEILSPARLSLASSVLARSDDVIGQMLGVGTTVVHGDYWFHNAQVLPDGRRVLVDWQECRIWSGLWELAYFMNLLHIAGRSRFSYRQHLPVSEHEVTIWYIDALREHGVALAHDNLERPLACARIWQPLLHWLPRYRKIVEGATRLPGWSILRRAPPAVGLLFVAAGYGGAKALLVETFDHWEREVRAWMQP